jgi:hypothetical protein
MNDYYEDPYGQIPTAVDYEKDPDEVIDFPFDWSGRLDGDTIATSTWVLENLTEVSTAATFTATTIFVSGGSLGTTGKITNRITTDGGRTWEKTIRIAVREV